jgi:hypothetical protein
MFTQIVFAQLADAGERHATVLESVLGETPQEFESPILRHADLQKRCSSPPTARRSEFRRSHLRSQFCALEGAFGDLTLPYFARSQASQTAKNGEVHAAGACALPFRAGRDRPRPGCRLLLGAAGYEKS